MKVHALKYVAAFVLPMLVAVSFISGGPWSWLPVIFAFVLLPLLEWWIGEDHTHLASVEASIAAFDRAYDLLLYLTVPVQWGTLIWFLFIMQRTSGFSAEGAGHIASMGLMCGVYGINVAHELGHRPDRFEQLLSKTMLLSSLYMHFFIEHNRGHHRNVGTPDDPATARRGENIYWFWMRSLTMSVVSAWHIVARERKRKSLSTWSVRNELIQYALLEITLCIAIYLLFGAMAAIAFVIAAVIGMLLLESVNYIEHYGLMRTRINDKRYEDVLPVHSWNSDFVLGRLVLFELTRHSDHHSEPSKHYQYLASMPTSGQLPAGYPAMLVLSLFPPLWFRVMDHRIPLKSA